MVSHTSGVCFFQLSDPAGLVPSACRVPSCWHCICLDSGCLCFCLRGFSTGASHSPWVIIPAISSLTYWTSAISTQKHALKQPLKASAALPCLHYPISTSQQTSLRLLFPCFLGPFLPSHYHSSKTASVRVTGTFVGLNPGLAFLWHLTQWSSASLALFLENHTFFFSLHHRCLCSVSADSFSYVGMPIRSWHLDFSL